MKGNTKYLVLTEQELINLAKTELEDAQHCIESGRYESAFKCKCYAEVYEHFLQYEFDTFPELESPEFGALWNTINIALSKYHVERK